MPESVQTFGGIFADKIGRGMTIVAGSYGVVRGLYPAVVLLVHDMTIFAGGGVIAQVRVSFAVMKSI